MKYSAEFKKLSSRTYDDEDEEDEERHTNLNL